MVKSQWDPENEHEGWTNRETWDAANYLRDNLRRAADVRLLIGDAFKADPGVAGVTYLMACEAGYLIRKDYESFATTDPTKVNWAEIGSVFLEDILARGSETP